MAVGAGVGLIAFNVDANRLVYSFHGGRAAVGASNSLFRLVGYRSADVIVLVASGAVQVIKWHRCIPP